MGKVATRDLIDQYQRSFRMLYSEMERFDDTQWVKGLSSFQVPVKVAMHIVDCLDYYFSGETGRQYQWGHRFGGGCWELSDDQLPDKSTVLAYVREIEDRVIGELTSLDDEDLSRPFEIGDGSGTILLGHYIYALRHTMHHHGELAVLSIYHGNKGGSWE